MSYFEEGGTLPTPFNMIPSPKSLWYLIRWLWRQLRRKKIRRKPESFGTIGVSKTLPFFSLFCLIFWTSEQVIHDSDQWYPLETHQRTENRAFLLKRSGHAMMAAMALQQSSTALTNSLLYISGGSIQDGVAHGPSAGLTAAANNSYLVSWSTFLRVWEQLI